MLRGAEGRPADEARPEILDERSAVPRRRIVANGNFLALCLMHGAQAYGWHFNITCLPQFLEKQYHLPNTSLLAALYVVAFLCWFKIDATRPIFPASTT
ncbi:MAG: hypothetical protein WC076_00125 [Terrimicrobiaceae bacterium]|nr:hypothetical protein [Terrimicrobiaceae bacterium]